MEIENGETIRLISDKFKIVLPTDLNPWSYRKNPQ